MAGVGEKEEKGMGGHGGEEIVRLHKALSAFFRAQWERLVEKKAQGFTGWDDPDDLPDTSLIARIYQKAERLRRWSDAGEVARKDLLDIANFALFLWHRERQRDLEDSLSERKDA